MTEKKTQRANLEQHKVLYFLMGAVVALAGLLVAFEWGERDVAKAEIEQTYVIEEIEDIQITPPEETPPPPEPEPVEEVVVDVLQVVEDDVEVADVTIASVDDAADKVARDFTPPAPTQVARKEEVADDHIFEFLEEEPEFPGGVGALMKWLSDHINYPPIAAENNVQGRVLVSFVVERDGSVSDVKVVRGVDPNLDKEAVRVVKLLPKWKPGMQTGKPVRYRYNLPVTFRLR
ncbi:MAG: energy transducer TonB [Porphyromonas sp.]|nr:energy transducer TonB [Porphyromonas sp.]